MLLALTPASSRAQSGGSSQSDASAESEAFSIVKPQLLDGEDGYPLPPNRSYYPGETVYVVFHVGGYHVTEYEYKMKISYRVEFLGVGDAPFAEVQAGEDAGEVYPQDEDWMPIVRASARIPFHAEAGKYRVLLHARDELRPQEEARHEIVFDVMGKELSDVEKLTVRNFAFQAREDGEPIEDPSYRQGATLWGSFYITGFELNQDNKYDVDSRLQVRNDEEEVMFSFVPQDEAGESFYPRRWIPGRFRVDLDEDIPTGEYVLVLSVQDRLGDQKFETRYPFEIR